MGRRRAKAGECSQQSIISVLRLRRSRHPRQVSKWSQGMATGGKGDSVNQKRLGERMAFQSQAPSHGRAGPRTTRIGRESYRAIAAPCSPARRVHSSDGPVFHFARRRRGRNGSLLRDLRPPDELLRAGLRELTPPQNDGMEAIARFPTRAFGSIRGNPRHPCRAAFHPSASHAPLRFSAVLALSPPPSRKCTPLVRPTLPPTLSRSACWPGPFGELVFAGIGKPIQSRPAGERFSIGRASVSSRDRAKA